jgi:hypothetical protein
MILVSSKKKHMKRQDQTSEKERKGDTGRTSSQGRKLSSGGESNKRGNPEMDDNAKSIKTELKIRSEKPRRK